MKNPIFFPQELIYSYLYHSNLLVYLFCLKYDLLESYFYLWEDNVNVISSPIAIICQTYFSMIKYQKIFPLILYLCLLNYLAYLENAQFLEHPLFSLRMLLWNKYANYFLLFLLSYFLDTFILEKKLLCYFLKYIQKSLNYFYFAFNNLFINKKHSSKKKVENNYNLNILN